MACRCGQRLTMVEQSASLKNDKVRIAQTVADNLPCGIYRFRYSPDDTCRFEYVSENVQSILGHTADELYTNPDLIWQSMHPDDKERTYKRMLTNIQEGQPWDSEWRIILPSGEVRWVREKGSVPITCSDGSIVWDCLLEDVSVRHNQVMPLEDQSIQAEQSLYKMLSIIPGLVFQTRHYPDGRIEFIYISEAATDLLGVSPQALKQDADLMWNRFHPEDLPGLISSITRSVQSKIDWDHVWRARHTGVNTIWLHGKGRHFATLDDGSILRVGVCTDITRERQLQIQLDSQSEALQGNEQTLQKITDVIAGVIVQARYNADGPIEYLHVSQGALELFGITSDNLMADSQLFWELCHPDDKARVKASIRHAITTRDDWEESWRINRPNGDIRWVRVSSRHYRTLADDTAIRVSCFMDVSHEKQLEQTKQQLEADVQEARQRLIDINNVIPGCVYLVRQKADGTRTYPFMSAGGERLFERPLEQLRQSGRLILDYSHPDDRAMLTTKLDNSFKYNGLLHVVWRILTPSGKIKWIRGDSRPFRTEDDGTVLRAGFLIDVTREQELEENLKETSERLARILDAMPGGLYQSEVAPDGRQTLLFANQNTWTQVGLPADSPLSDSNKLLEGIVLEDREPFRESVRISREELSPHHLRFRFRRYDNGEIMHMAVHTRPSKIEGSDNVLFTGVALDVSLQAELEEKLLQEKMRAEEASIAKSTFLANVSHEMRTPLNGILGYGQLLAHELDLTGQAARNLSSLRQCGDHLLAVINEVLDMAKIESGRLELDLKPMALYRLLDEVSSVITPLADSKGLMFHLNTTDDLPGYIKSDATRLRQVLINLLNNAVKFTSDGEVSLNCSIKGDTLRFDIHDTGCGIPHSRIDKIFQPFERMDMHHAVEGTGLGLAITRRIIEALEGSVTLKSTEGVGSCFSIQLPCEEAQAIQDANNETDFQLRKLTVSPPPRLLVVDDRESNRDVMKQWLSLGGFDVVLAANGQDALDQLQKQPFDLVLSDLRMPVMDGMTMMAIIKEDEILKNIPCIAISASVFPEQVRKVLLSGFREFLPKPCNLNRLFATIYDILNLQSEAVGGEEPKAKEARQELSAPFPEQERTAILDMLDMGDIEGLQDHIHHLKGAPGLQATAHKLSQCLDELDMEGFRRVLHSS